MALHKIPSCYSVKYSHMYSQVIWKTIFTEHSLMLHQEMPLECLFKGESFTSVLCGDGGEFSGPELISDGLEESGNVCCGQMSPCFRLIWEENGIEFSQPHIHQRQAIWVTCIIVKVTLTWRHMFGLYRDIDCHQVDIFPGIQDNARPHSARVTTEWFLDALHHRRDVPACLLQSSYVSYGKCITHYEKENQAIMTTDC